MPPTELRGALQRLFATWKDDLSPGWRAFFGDAEVDPSRIPAAGLPLVPPSDVIFPGRKALPPKGARPDAHVARAFDGITPAKVRVVVIGQDPYLHVDQATGRSFEQADVGASLGGASPSLRRILQAVALVRTGDRRYVDGASAWQRLLAARSDGTLDLAAPLPLWDRWQKAGVIFVNAAATFNKFQAAYQRAHLAFWTPVVGRLATALARRKGPGAVFVAWGNFARGVLQSAGVEQAARDAGRWGTRVAIVTGPHPNAIGPGPPFLAGRSPFGEINAALAQVGESPISW
jgi:uracil-DNA glycosylase